MANIYDMTEQDKNKLAYNSQEWAKANQAGNTTLADKLHSESEGIRAQYGYSGGADGSQIIPLGATKPVTDYSQYITDAHEAQKESAIAELEGAYKASVADLDRAEQKIAPQYQAARNQTAGTSEQEKRAFAEYAAARGLNSGTGGQAELARSLTLQGNMNAINQSESEAVADIATQRAKLASDYQMAITQARAQGDLARATALYQEYVRQDEAAREMEKYREQMNLAWAEYNAGRADNTWNQNRTEARDAVSDRQAEYNANLAMAQFLAQSGDFSGLRDMGIDTTQLESVWQVDRNLAVQLAQKQLATAASGGTTAPQPTMAWEEIYREMRNSGNPQAYLTLNASRFGLASSQIEGFMAGYTDWEKKNPVDGATQPQSSGGVVPPSAEGNAPTISPNSRIIENAARNASTMRSGGRSVDEIYLSLKSQGYSDSIIDEAFAILGF